MSASTPQTIRVLIIDDHVVVCEGLCMLLESQPGVTVVGTAATCADALAMAAREQPDIILLDLDLGGERGLDCLSKLHAIASGARVIILTGVRDPALHRQAVRLGAMGLVLKERGSETLFKAIERVHAGEAWLERAMMASVLGQITRGSQPPDPEAAKIACAFPPPSALVQAYSTRVRTR